METIVPFSVVTSKPSPECRANSAAAASAFFPPRPACDTRAGYENRDVLGSAGRRYGASYCVIHRVGDFRSQRRGRGIAEPDAGAVVRALGQIHQRVLQPGAADRRGLQRAAESSQVPHHAVQRLAHFSGARGGAGKVHAQKLQA